MPEAVQPGIFWGTVLGHDARLHLHTVKDALHEIRVVLGVAGAGAKDQAGLVAFQEWPQRIQDHRPNWYVTLARLGLGRADNAITVGALSHMDFRGFGVNILS